MFTGLTIITILFFQLRVLEVGTVFQSSRLQQVRHHLSVPRPTISSFWCGFNMSTFPPSKCWKLKYETFTFCNVYMLTLQATLLVQLTWLYMPVIFAALGIICPSWTFPESDLPQQWHNWVSTFSTAFQSDQPAIN